MMQTWFVVLLMFMVAVMCLLFGVLLFARKRHLDAKMSRLPGDTCCMISFIFTHYIQTVHYIFTENSFSYNPLHAVLLLLLLLPCSLPLGLKCTALYIEVRPRRTCTMQHARRSWVDWIIYVCWHCLDSQPSTAYILTNIWIQNIHLRYLEGCPLVLIDVRLFVGGNIYIHPLTEHRVTVLRDPVDPKPLLSEPPASPHPAPAGVTTPDYAEVCVLPRQPPPQYSERSGSPEPYASTTLVSPLEAGCVVQHDLFVSAFILLDGLPALLSHIETNWHRRRNMTHTLVKIWEKNYYPFSKYNYVFFNHSTVCRLHSK